MAVTLKDITREEWEALPQKVKDYIRDLECQADPAGTVREAFAQRENARALACMIEEGAHGHVIRDGHVVPKNGGPCALCGGPANYRSTESIH